jgi:protein SCO1/2
MKSSWTAILLLAATALPGCHSPHQPAPVHGVSQIQGIKTYKLRGKVVSLDASSGEVTLKHEAVPGYMEAMTMPYKLKDRKILTTLHPGDGITADLLVSSDPNVDDLIDNVLVVAQARPGPQ